MHQLAMLPLLASGERRTGYLAPLLATFDYAAGWIPISLHGCCG